MDNIYDLLIWFWGVMGADEIPYFINNSIYILTFLFFCILITIPFWFVIIIRIVGKFLNGGYND